ncbi:MAG: Ig domain-containing protein, partial [Acidimicrobiales bacterium]
PNPTGTVDFYECGPTASAQDCTSASWTQFDTESLSGTQNPGTATSVPFTPSAPGYWCFASVYSGDGNYAGSSDASTDECFDVLKAPVTLSGSPTSSTASLGGPNNDVVTIDGSISNVDPSGSITFYECGPTVSAQACTSGTEFGSTALSGTQNPVFVVSPTFTATSTGYWCLEAVYSGDTTYATTDDTSTSQCYDVTPGSSSLTSAPEESTIELGSSDTDASAVYGNSTAGVPTGTVSFYECGPTTSAQSCTSKANEVGGPVDLTGGSGNSATADSVSFTPTSAGYWCFSAYYSGNSEYGASQDTTVDGCVQVIQPLEVSTSTLPDATKGSSYSTTLTAIGGKRPYTWTLKSGTLPAGITLSTAGVISGKPSAKGTFTFTVQVKDSSSPKQKASKSLTLVVNKA